MPVTIERYYGFSSRTFVDEQRDFYKSIQFECVPEQALLPHLYAFETNPAQAVANFQAGDLHTIDISYVTASTGPILSQFHPETCWRIIEIYIIDGDGEPASGDDKRFPCYIKPTGRKSTPEKEGLCCILPISASDEEALEQLFTITPGKRAQAVFNAIGPATRFSAARFYYVGAALCVGLVDNNGVVQGFFDMGCHVRQVHPPTPQMVCANSSKTDIDAVLSDGNHKTIIISHWHEDHINYMTASAHLDPTRISLFYPQPHGSPAAAQFLVRPGFVQLNELPDVLPAAAPAATQIGGCASLTAYKIDAFDNITQPIINSHKHVHHHGICAKLDLVNGHKVLLAGDCTYAGFPQALRDFTWGDTTTLQVCHHGGKYNLSPALQDRFVRRTLVPHRTVAAAGGAIQTAVYSADGVRYGHPAQYSIDDHIYGGWNNRVELHTYPGQPAPNHFYDAT